MADVEVLKTNKGGVKIVYDFQYRKKKENMNGTITWKCCECPARLQTRLPPDYLNPRVLGVHNHLSNPLATDIIRCRQDMKRRVEEQPEKVLTVVYREKLLQVPTCIVAQLPNKETVGRALRRERSKLRPPLPATANDLELAPYQVVTSANDRFLLFDDRHEGDRMLLFVSDFFLRLLCAAPLVFADGTFRSVPHIFTQLFTLSFMYHNKMLPATMDMNLAYCICVTFS